jgi:hypothetical protein
MLLYSDSKATTATLTPQPPTPPCLQLLLALDVASASAQEVHELRGLLREALRGCKDSGASQELEAWQEGLNTVEEGHAEEMSREEVMDLICVSGPAA